MIIPLHRYFVKSILINKNIRKKLYSHYILQNYSKICRKYFKRVQLQNFENHRLNLINSPRAIKKYNTNSCSKIYISSNYEYIFCRERYLTCTFHNYVKFDIIVKKNIVLKRYILHKCIEFKNLKKKFAYYLYSIMKRSISLSLLLFPIFYDNL